MWSDFFYFSLYKYIFAFSIRSVVVVTCMTPEDVVCVVFQTAHLFFIKSLYMMFFNKFEMYFITDGPLIFTVAFCTVLYALVGNVLLCRLYNDWRHDSKINVHFMQIVMGRSLHNTLNSALILSAVMHVTLETSYILFPSCCIHVQFLEFYWCSRWILKLKHSMYWFLTCKKTFSSLDSLVTREPNFLNFLNFWIFFLFCIIILLFLYLTWSSGRKNGIVDKCQTMKFPLR